MIRSKEELLAAIPALVGEEKTEADETIAFLEDIADTMDDLNGKVAEDFTAKYAEYETKLTEAETKYNENEAAWKKRYTERFLKGEETDPPAEPPKKDPDPDEPQPTEDLFKKE